MYKIISICKGGGYNYCRTEPVHPNANTNRLYPLHRVLMENSIGRNLLRGEHVHHINGDKFDNRLSNLELLAASEHARLHRVPVEDIECICEKCGKTFYVEPHFYRLRLKRNKSGKVFCSHSCAARK